MSEKHRYDEKYELAIHSLAGDAEDLDRLPTFSEIVSHKRKSPVDLRNLYSYMKYEKFLNCYLNFLFDLVDHDNLCKHYVRGLRKSVIECSHVSANKPLLELVIRKNVLDDADAAGISAFLRGEIVDPELQEMVEQYNNLLTGSSSLNTLLVHLLKEQDHLSNMVTSENLKESAHNLLIKYFVKNLENSLEMPDQLRASVTDAVETEGRYDPDVFDGAKDHVFKYIEESHLPKFLPAVAARNINSSIGKRVFIGNIGVYGGSLVGTGRFFGPNNLAVTMALFFVAMYFTVSVVFGVDPIMARLKVMDSFAPSGPWVKVEDPFICKSIMKRSKWVLLAVFLSTVIITAIIRAVGSALDSSPVA